MTDPRSLNCQEVFRRLDEFLDRELSEDEMGLVQRHLDACVQCAAERRFEGRVLDAIRAKLPRLQAPDGLLKRVAAVLAEERGRGT
jgi:anti-sigma factor (TIGR02949 family)